MFDNIVKVCQGSSKFPAVDCLGGFAGVFEGDSKIGTARAGRFRGLKVSCCIADLGLGIEVSNGLVWIHAVYAAEENGDSWVKWVELRLAIHGPPRHLMKDSGNVYIPS